MNIYVHIVYPETGIEFSQLKEIFAAFDGSCKPYLDTNSELEKGKVIKVESGSIWLEVVLPIVQSTFPLFVNYLTSKLCKKKSKIEVCMETMERGETIKITIES